MINILRRFVWVWVWFWILSVALPLALAFVLLVVLVVDMAGIYDIALCESMPSISAKCK